MTVVVAIIGLIFLIVIHELGHMLTAKALGVRVPEFAVGFGPALFKKKIGETVYSFRIILLGGFAKMAGMEGMTSVEVDKGDLGPDTFPSKSAWRRALIIFAGPFANILATVVILTGLYLATPVPSLEVERVVPDSLAAEVGVQRGDRLVALDGRPTDEWREFAGVVAGKEPGERVTFAVERGGERKEFSGELTADPGDPDRALVGVQPAASGENYGLIESTGMALSTTWEITLRLGAFVGQLVTGEQNFYDNVTGPVGIASVGSTAVIQGFFLQLLALISLNLALFNLLPMLPLDGGHLFFIAAEKVIGRPVRPETVGKVTAVGVMLVLALFLFATYADLSKLITGQPFIPE